jgi:hypothetical protein
MDTGLIPVERNGDFDLGGQHEKARRSIRQKPWRGSVQRTDVKDQSKRPDDYQTIWIRGE